MPISKEISTNSLLKDFIDHTSGRVDYQKLKNDQWLTERVNEWETMKIGEFTYHEKFAF